MTSPTQPTPEEIAAAESLVEPVVCANGGGGNEYERLPTISEIALRLREMRAEWVKPQGETESGATFVEISSERIEEMNAVGDALSGGPEIRQLQKDLAAAVARAEKAEAALNNCEVEVGRVTELAATGIHSCAAQAEEIKRLRDALTEIHELPVSTRIFSRVQAITKAALSAAPVVAKEGK